MKKLRDLGIASIILSSIIGCSSVSSITEKNILKTRVSNEILVNGSGNKYSGQVVFMPNKSYTLNESLIGNYRLIGLKSDSLRTRVVVQYLNHRDEIYQQAMFAHDVIDNSMRIQVVEIDWNCDGLRDMLLHSERIVVQENVSIKPVVSNKLKLVNRLESPMIDYVSSNYIATNANK